MVLSSVVASSDPAYRPAGGTWEPRMFDPEELVMVRADLENIPDYPLPAAYTIRWHGPGDEALWIDLQTPFYDPGAVTLDLFRAQFGADPQRLAARLLYLLNPAGQAIGTAAAWAFDGFRGPEYGRVHWVALAENYQGRGLSKPLLTRVCLRLRELGHTKAYLTTSHDRPIAVSLYRKFGFVELPAA